MTETLPDTAPLTADGVRATARAAGVPLTEETARRVVRALSPAFTGFAPVARTLPFDLEPAGFLAVQRQDANAR